MIETSETQDGKQEIMDETGTYFFRWICSAADLCAGAGRLTDTREIGKREEEKMDFLRFAPYAFGFLMLGSALTLFAGLALAAPQHEGPPTADGILLELPIQTAPVRTGGPNGQI